MRSVDGGKVINLAQQYWEESRTLTDISRYLDTDAEIRAFASAAAGFFVHAAPPWPPMDDPALMAELSDRTRDVLRVVCGLPEFKDRTAFGDDLADAFMAEIYKRKDES